MSSKELLDHLSRLKIPARNHASTLVEAYVDKIRKNLADVIEVKQAELEVERRLEEEAEDAAEAAERAEREQQRPARIAEESARKDEEESARKAEEEAQAKAEEAQRLREAEEHAKREAERCRLAKRPSSVPPKSARDWPSRPRKTRRPRRIATARWRRMPRRLSRCRGPHEPHHRGRQDGAERLGQDARRRPRSRPAGARRRQHAAHRAR